MTGVPNCTLAVLYCSDVLLYHFVCAVLPLVLTDCLPGCQPAQVLHWPRCCSALQTCTSMGLSMRSRWATLETQILGGTSSRLPAARSSTQTPTAVRMTGLPRPQSPLVTPSGVDRGNTNARTLAPMKGGRYSRGLCLGLLLLLIYYILFDWP